MTLSEFFFLYGPKTQPAVVIQSDVWQWGYLCVSELMWRALLLLNRQGQVENTHTHTNTHTHRDVPIAFPNGWAISLTLSVALTQSLFLLFLSDSYSLPLCSFFSPPFLLMPLHLCFLTFLFLSPCVSQLALLSATRWGREQCVNEVYHVDCFPRSVTSEVLGNYKMQKMKIKSPWS